MTDYGRAGASRGLFFNRYLRAVLLSERKIDFTGLSLDYLLNGRYAIEFTRKVYSSPLIAIDELLAKTGFLTNGTTQQLPVTPNNTTYRVEYHSMNEYAAYARQLNIMADSKAGVPRTAYRGIVTCFINGIRIYLTMPEGQWNSYDRNWQAPPDALIGE
jgi:alpha-1,3-mannosyl-glycoprotein beta-1,2-N-acetylglucosaminyltransferase